MAVEGPLNPRGGGGGLGGLDGGGFGGFPIRLSTLMTDSNSFRCKPDHWDAPGNASEFSAWDELKRNTIHAITEASRLHQERFRGG